MTVLYTPPSDLPGAELVATGLADLGEGRATAQAFLVACAASRLRAIGIEVPGHDIADPGRELYSALGAQDPVGAYSTYNALRRRLVSFCEAAEADARRRHR